METTGWFVPIDEDPQCSGPGAEAVEDPESEGGGVRQLPYSIRGY